MGGVTVTRTKGKLVKGSKEAKEWMESIRPGKLTKGSEEAKEYMAKLRAKLRAKRGMKKKTTARKTKR